MRAQPEVCRLLEASLRDGKWGGKSVLLAYISDSIRKASSTSGEVQYSDETWSAAMPMYNTGNSAAVRLLAETFGGPSLDGVQRRMRGMSSEIHIPREMDAVSFTAAKEFYMENYDLDLTVSNAPTFPLQLRLYFVFTSAKILKIRVS